MRQSLHLFELPKFPLEAQEMLSEKMQNFYHENGIVWAEAFSKLQEQKAQIFSQYHFEFDSQGNPILNEEGFPQLYEGAETTEQALARQNWETKQQNNIQQNALGEKNGFLKTFTENYQTAIQNNIGTLADPAVQAKLQAMVSAAEVQMDEMEHNLQLNVLKAGLPIPALQEKADELSKKFRKDERDFLSQLWETPEGEEIAQYQVQAKGVLFQQKLSLLSHSVEPIGTSPSLLSTLVPSSENTDLAEAIQNAILGASQHFKATFHLS